MMPLAACEGTTLSDRVGGLLLTLAVTAFWVGAVWLLVWFHRNPEERRALFVILFLAGGAAAAVLAIPYGVGLETLVFPALIAILLVGAVGSLFLRVGLLRALGTALIGGLFLPAAVVVIVLVATFLGGTCLGEELG
jgi:hypothetical protein